MSNQTLHISATFTAEPIEPTLAFWLAELGLPAQLTFAPYNQVFQHLLGIGDRGSGIGVGAHVGAPLQNAVHILLIRFEDWGDDVQKAVTEFTQLLATVHAPCIVCICPPSPDFDPQQQAQLEQLVSDELASLNGVHLVLPHDILTLYPIETIHDPYGDAPGHIPYTPLFFTALGTMVARRVYALMRPPRKVIVLDCDETLWQGVCGEVAPAGLTLTSHHHHLQTFILDQYNSGMLLCLCSHNNLEDVQAVFANRPDMPLTWQHFVAHRINWQAKSTSLRELADELQLSLDSFIFLDDNPIVCADVQANCPAVLTLQLPADPSQIPNFLAHIWEFDHLTITETDKRRSQLYQENKQRQAHQATAPSYADFLASLDLIVDIAPAQPHQIDRLAQLTQRTNQFNFTTKRYTPTTLPTSHLAPDTPHLTPDTSHLAPDTPHLTPDTSHLAPDTPHLTPDTSHLTPNTSHLTPHILVIHVRDRFGDYGLVGTVIYQQNADHLAVDTFLLSCRVLGRGVEHRLLNHLTHLAQTHNLTHVAIPFIPTPKNTPAQQFLEAVGSEFRDDEGVYGFPAGYKTVFSGQSSVVSIQSRPTPHAPRTPRLTPDTSHLTLRTPTAIFTAIQTHTRRPRPNLPTPYEPPQTSLENHLTHLWQQFLNIHPIGRHDNFFTLGGDSLSGVQIINRLQAQHNDYLYITTLFDAPTIAELANYLTGSGERGAGSGKEFSVFSFPSSVASSSPRTPLLTPRTSHLTPDTPHLTPDTPHLTPRTSHLIPRTSHLAPIFLLSPPRSGSTLLRVMLAGHPELFAPPELDLLGFETLGERRERLSGREQYRLNGPIHTLMHLHGLDYTQAQAKMAELEQQNLPIANFYHQLQTNIGQRTLIDKSVYYALDIANLRQAHHLFPNARYIHLSRHPNGMLHSFESVRMDRLFNAKQTFQVSETWKVSPNSPRDLAEHLWHTAHQNILTFLDGLPADQHIHLTYENLVTRPEQTLTTLCHFLNIPLHPALLTPYDDPAGRMADTSAGGRMRGDPKFHQHRQINPHVATRWQQTYTHDTLSDQTWATATRLGYHRPPKSATAPLSFAQQRQWILNQLEPNSPAYNIPLAYRLTGSLDPTRLDQALNQLAQRQASLRTTFINDNGTPRQNILPEANLSLQFIETSPKDLADHLLREAHTPFDLTTAPLLRVTLYKLSDGDHILLTLWHHIIADRWSIGAFMREWLALYRGDTLPPLDWQYTDFAHWQQHILDDHTWARSRNYWTQQLANLPPLLTLPTDFPRPGTQSYNGATTTFTLPHITPLDNTITPFMTLFASFVALVHRYTGETDIPIGTPHANRNRPELEPLIGFFVNTLVLRADLSGNPTFRQLLDHIRQLTLSAHQHHTYPFEQLVHTLQPQRDPGRTPLFQLFFAYQNTPTLEIGDRGSGIRDLTPDTPHLTPYPFDPQTAKFDLSVYIDGSQARIEYSTDLYKPDTIDRLITHWQTLLTACLAHPDQPIATLPLLSETEKRQLLHEWQGQPAPYPNATLHELFEQQVQRTPHAIVTQSITYTQLNEQANQLAHYLIEQGTRPGDPIALCLERTPLMLTAILGTLKAGAMYLPLDPSYPAGRLTYMLNDAKPKYLLVDQQTATLFNPAETLPILNLHTHWPNNTQTTNPTVNLTPDTSAYLIYTSGSTGQPKGVVGLHRGAVNRCQWMWDTYPFTPNDICCQKTALSFVDSIWEIFGPLLRGVPLILIPDDIVRDPSRLLATLTQERITRLVLVPSLLSTLLESEAPLPSSLTLCISSGEALPPHLAQQFRQRLPHATLLNLYGSSEVSADVTYCDITQLDILDTIPLGRPIANTTVYLLDHNRQPVPIGLTGELYIGGAGLAHGYHNRPELTAERFINYELGIMNYENDAPFIIHNSSFILPNSSLILYKTGDLARWNTNGQLEFLGRADQQVKIRGYRIELAEIELALTQHPAVQTAVVLPNEQSLTAYVTVFSFQFSVHSSQLPATILHGYLSQTLPTYMLPANYVFLDEFPLTPNGKIDRQQLKNNQQSTENSQLKTSHQPSATSHYPLSTTHYPLLQIWRNILNHPRLTPHDNFFLSGGHSLLAVRLVNEIKRVTGQTLAPTAVFQAPTVVQMAELLEKRGWSPKWTSLTPIQPNGPRPGLFCIGPYTGELWSFAPLAHRLGTDQPLYGLQPRGLTNGHLPINNMVALASHYLAEIRTLQPNGPYYLAGSCFGAIVALEMAHQLHEQNEPVALLALLDPVWPRPKQRWQRWHYYLHRLRDHLRTGQVTVRLKRRVQQGVRLSQARHLVSSEQARREREVAQANLQAVRAYTLRPYAGTITFIQSEERQKDWQALKGRVSLGDWASLAPNGWDYHVIPNSGHLNLLQEPYVAVVAEKLKEKLT